jgi:hypothetical protein
LLWLEITIGLAVWVALDMLFAYRLTLITLSWLVDGTGSDLPYLLQIIPLILLLCIVMVLSIPTYVFMLFRKIFGLEKRNGFY